MSRTIAEWMEEAFRRSDVSPGRFRPVYVTLDEFDELCRLNAESKYGNRFVSVQEWERIRYPSPFGNHLCGRPLVVLPDERTRVTDITSVTSVTSGLTCGNA